MESSHATRNAQRSGCRTARVFGKTSQPSSTSAASAIRINASAQCVLNESRSATASIAALAKVFPSASVASKSCGCSSSRATVLPARGFFSARSATCHLPSENSAVSASAKKKLAPANTKIAVIAVSMRGVCRKNDAGKRRNARHELTSNYKILDGLQNTPPSSQLWTASDAYQKYYFKIHSRFLVGRGDSCHHR